MWKNISLVLGAIAIVLGSLYVLYVKGEKWVVSTQAPQTMAADHREPLSVEPTPAGDDQNSGVEDSAAPGGKPSAQEDRSTARPEIPTADLAALLKKLMGASRTRADGEHEAPGQDVPQHYTSKDISPDNGTHHFLLAAELFPEVDRDWLYTKLAEFKANGWPDDPELWMLFDKFRDSFDAIRTGLEVGNAMMPTMRSFSEQMPYLAKFRDLARIMAMEGQMYAAQGNYEAAFDNYTALIGFANESARGGPIISGLVGYAIGGIAIDSLAETLEWGGASPQDCRVLIERMQSLEGQAYSAWEMADAEVQTFETWLGTILDEKTDLRELLRSESGGLELLVAISSEEQIESLLRGAVRDYRDFIGHFALPYYEAQAVDTDALISENPVSQILLPGMGKLPAQEARASARCRGTMIMAGVELYRTENDAYPASLDGLVPKYLSTLHEDPFTGNSFVYSSTESGYLLYSTGSDMQDDGGATDDWDAQGADMVFHRD